MPPKIFRTCYSLPPLSFSILVVFNVQVPKINKRVKHVDCECDSRTWNWNKTWKMKRQDGFVAEPHSNHLRQPRGALPSFLWALGMRRARPRPFSTPVQFGHLCILRPGVLVRALAKCTCSADAPGRRTNRTVSYIREVAERSQ